MTGPRNKEDDRSGLEREVISSKEKGGVAKYTAYSCRAVSEEFYSLQADVLVFSIVVSRDIYHTTWVPEDCSQETKIHVDACVANLPRG